MFPKDEKLGWLELRKLVSDWVGFVADYMSFIISIRPDLKNQEMVDELKKLENNIANATEPFLTYEETLELQNKIFPLILDWNPDIEDQSRKFYNSLVEMARLTAKSESLKTSYDPFKSLKEREEKFDLARDVVTNIQNSVNVFKPTTVEVYAMFYGLITTTHVVHHSIFTQYKKSLELFELDKKYDADFIFSVSTNYKNREDEIRSDLRDIRNSIAHFNFKLQKSEDGLPVVVLNLDSKTTPKQIPLDEFSWIYFNSIFLLQTFLAIQYWQVSFATLRGTFVKKRMCPKCKKGDLNIGSTEKIYETRDDPTLHMFWFCKKCEEKFPLKN
jgi:hypothetical protein